MLDTRLSEPIAIASILDLRERLGITRADLAAYEEKLSQCERIVATTTKEELDQTRAQIKLAETEVQKAEETYYLVRLMQANSSHNSADHRFLLTEELSPLVGSLSVNGGADWLATRKDHVVNLKIARENLCQEYNSNQKRYTSAVLEIQSEKPLLTKYKLVQKHVEFYYDGKKDRHYWCL
jgi:hypothetical protein